MKHIETFENFDSKANNETSVNEGMNLRVNDPYARQIWNGYQKDILALIAKINKDNYDGNSSEIICDGLTEIMTALAEADDSVRKEMNTK
jgi:hypothetical protein